MSGEECGFTLEHYKHCLDIAKKKGYKFLTLKEYSMQHKNFSETDKVIILRHDIDFDIQLALKLAKIEHELGLKATYYIRIHGKYHPFDLENYKAIKELKKMGHELGLHYDCDFASMFGEDPVVFLKRDIAIFEGMTGEKMQGLSTHEPGRSSMKITDSDLEKFGITYQAYSDIFFKQMKYISDSSCRWREGCMCNFIKKDTPKLCILTHPFWWFDKTPLESWC